MCCTVSRPSSPAQCMQPGVCGRLRAYDAVSTGGGRVFIGQDSEDEVWPSQWTHSFKYPPRPGGPVGRPNKQG